MPYERELAFLKDMFAKCRVQLLVVDMDDVPILPIDLGLRAILGISEREESGLLDAIRSARPRTLYRMTDTFLCTYLYFLLPDASRSPRLVVIGPYLSVELGYEQLLEQCEQLGLDMARFPMVQKYYGGLSVVTSDGSLYAAVDSLAELLWGRDGYTMVDVNREPPVLVSAPVTAEGDGASDDPGWQASVMERRYAYENELMQAVSQGQTHKAELLLAGFSKLSFERRLADPVRNLKNYCIIMNTLLRKAAEQGGVHPIYIDRLSSDYARRIETITTVEGAPKLMDEIFRGYCRLVRKNATSHYSPPVERTILYIDLNLGGDLRLQRLAEEQNINASYLSSLFKKETGHTLTDFINERRVQTASRLLRSTRLQVQTIAQHVGIADVNYFSKIFKKYTGKTPGEYRKEHREA